jgi:small subunit ribosomal protein S8
MSVSDPIADMLTRVRNAIIAKHPDTSMPHSTIKEEVARILQSEGYIDGYEVVEDGRFKKLVVNLKYVGNSRKERRPVITGIKRISKPGRRIYTTCDDIPWVLSGMGIAILTTPKGVMTGDEARRQRVGGEVLCHVW